MNAVKSAKKAAAAASGYEDIELSVARLKASQH